MSRDNVECGKKMFVEETNAVHLFKSGPGSFGEATVAYSWKIPIVETLFEFQIEPWAPETQVHRVNHNAKQKTCLDLFG